MLFYAIMTKEERRELIQTADLKFVKVAKTWYAAKKGETADSSIQNMELGKVIDVR